MMNLIEKERRELLELLIDKAYFKEKIVLSSGKESDYYIDARRVTLDGRGAYLCARMMMDIMGEDSIDAVGGPTLGADPMIGAISVLRMQEGNPVQAFIIRKAPKAHGKQQRVEGPLLKKGSRVVLIDDVATTGKAFTDSLDVLKSMGVYVHKAICLVDREEGAKEAVAAKGCALLSVFNINEIHR